MKSLILVLFLLLFLEQYSFNQTICNNRWKGTPNISFQYKNDTITNFRFSKQGASGFIGMIVLNSGSFSKNFGELRCPIGSGNVSGTLSNDGKTFSGRIYNIEYPYYYYPGEGRDAEIYRCLPYEEYFSWDAVQDTSTISVTSKITGDSLICILQNNDYNNNDPNTGFLWNINGTISTKDFGSSVKVYFENIGEKTISCIPIGCPSGSIQTLKVKVNYTPNISITDGQRCGEGPVTLSATADSGTICWYNNIGDSVIGNGAIFITPSLSKDTYFRAIATNNNCKATKYLNARIYSVIHEVKNDTVCGPIKATLLAKSGFGYIRWYTDSINGTLLYTSNDVLKPCESSFRTPIISASKVFWAEATGTGCPESARKPVYAVLRPKIPSLIAPKDTFRCGQGYFYLKASSDLGEIKWYENETSLTPLGSGTTYDFNVTSNFICYVEASYCNNKIRQPISVVIKEKPYIISKSDAVGCGPTALSLSATSSGGDIYWFERIGPPLGVGSIFTTPVLTASADYYAAAYLNGCESEHVNVKATIESQPKIIVSNDTSRCGPGSFLLYAFSDNSILNWYLYPRVDTPIFSGSTYTTPILNSTATYSIVASNNCGNIAKSITATIKEIPIFTEIKDSSRCGPGEVTLEANTNRGVINWYADSIGGPVLATGTKYITPSLSSNTVFYASTSNFNCISDRKAVHATVNDCSETNIMCSSEYKLGIIPNPAKDFVNILKPTSNEQCKIDIYNYTGKLIITSLIAAKEEKIKLDLSDFSPGFYIIKMQFKNNSFAGILIKK